MPPNTIPNGVHVDPAGPDLSTPDGLASYLEAWAKRIRGFTTVDGNASSSGVSEGSPHTGTQHNALTAWPVEWLSALGQVKDVAGSVTINFSF